MHKSIDNKEYTEMHYFIQQKKIKILKQVFILMSIHVKSLNNASHGF